MFTTENFTYGLIAFFIGAIPFSLIFTKLFSGKNVLREGSQNAGAMNSYEISGKKWIGLLVLIADFGKGALAVWVANDLGWGKFMPDAFAAFFVVLGHNFSPFLKFKGGRGLAAAAGAMAMIGPLMLLLWLLMWVTGYYAIRKDVHVANVVGTIGSIVLVAGAPDHAIFAQQILPNYYKPGEYKILCFLIGIIILIRHIKPMIKLLKNNRKKDHPNTTEKK